MGAEGAQGARGAEGALTLGDGGVTATKNVRGTSNSNSLLMLRSYRDLKVWKRSLILVADVYRITRKLPPDERFGLVSQMRRAAVSVTCNIAEGYGRTTRGEYLNHLSMARGSLYEVEALSELCQALSFLRSDEMSEVEDHLKEMRRMLRRLVEALRKKR